jgi:hypothetical protein
MDAPVPVQQKNTPSSQRPSATARAASSVADAQGTAAPVTSEPRRTIS